MLSLFGTDQIHGWATRLHRLQQNPLIVFGAAVGAILLATLIRWALGGLVHDRIPFTTYYPAIVVVLPTRNRAGAALRESASQPH